MSEVSLRGGFHGSAGARRASNPVTPIAAPNPAKRPVSATGRQESPVRASGDCRSVAANGPITSGRYASRRPRGALPKRGDDIAAPPVTITYLFILRASTCTIGLNANRASLSGNPVLCHPHFLALDSKMSRLRHYRCVPADVPIGGKADISLRNLSTLSSPPCPGNHDVHGRVQAKPPRGFHGQQG